MPSRNARLHCSLQGGEATLVPECQIGLVLFLDISPGVLKTVEGSRVGTGEERSKRPSWILRLFFSQIPQCYPLPGEHSTLRDGIEGYFAKKGSSFFPFPTFANSKKPLSAVGVLGSGAKGVRKILVGNGLFHIRQVEAPVLARQL